MATIIRFVLTVVAIFYTNSDMRQKGCRNVSKNHSGICTPSTSRLATLSTGISAEWFRTTVAMATID